MIGTILLLCAISAATPTSANDRDTAMAWAIEHRQEVFDQLLPSANRFGNDSSESATRFSVRAAGFEDHFEFLLEITCERGSDPEVTLTIPAGAPLVVQLADSRQRNALPLDEVIRQVRLERRSLPKRAARQLYDALINAKIPLRPQVGFFLHRQRLEVAAAGWNELRFDFFDEGRPNTDLGRLATAVWAAMRSVGVTPSTLMFDLDKHSQTKER